MALVWGDRVLETSTTTGTGAFTLAAAVTGYQRFSAICSTNDTIYYAIFAVDANGNPSGDWETGLGTYSGANTLTRTTVTQSTNANVAVNFAAGTKWVMATPTASWANGLTSRASTTEALTGTDTVKGVTPDALAALWEQGSDVASAGTTSLGEGGYFNVTGTTTITDIDFATDKAGRHAWVKFAGALTLTHSSTLVLPTSANITTAAGDTACFISEGSDTVRCVAYQRASGSALVGGGSGNAWNLQWGPLDNEAPATNYATLDSRNSHPVLDFDTTTQEAAVFTGVLPADYAGAGVTVSIWCAATSATSGTIGWDVSFERIDVSSLDIDADSFATAQTVTAVTVPGTSGQVLKMSLNVSNGANMDSTAAGELFRLRVRRDVANDTATGDAELLRVMLVSQ